jgi:hypothetical protein
MSEILGDIVITRGDSWPITVTIIGKTTKIPMDLTGYTVKLTVTSIKNPPDDTTRIFQCNGVVDPNQITNKGKVTFTPTREDTAVSIKAFYDIEISKDTLRKSFNTGKRFTIGQDNTK